MIGRLCIGEVRVDLEHLCSCSWKQCKKIHGSFSENNYPLVYIHCIIKIYENLNNSYISNVQKVSDPFDFPVKNLKSRAIAKVSVFVLHKVNKQSNHPKTKAWHIIFMIQWISTRG